MKRYRVELEAIEQEDVDAETPQEAEDIALESLYGYRPKWTILSVKEIENVVNS